MGVLRLVQTASGAWRDRNFPGHTGEMALLGMVEEQGEIAHHYLKRMQGIRGDEAMHREEIIDGVCDWIIFACGLANNEGFDLEDELSRVWDKVSKRDWVADPEKGGEDGPVGWPSRQQ